VRTAQERQPLAKRRSRKAAARATVQARAKDFAEGPM
jgi:hypothetical protein